MVDDNIFDAALLPATIFAGLGMAAERGKRLVAEDRACAAEGRAADARAAAAITAGSARGHAQAASRLHLDLAGANAEIARLRDELAAVRADRDLFAAAASQYLDRLEILEGGVH